ncbi:Photosynthetic NDH subunit of subcomplex B 3, chloroplastic [Porphyridium purpureum]|uniref:Photosynthetic NDH subunit of subcomplex B 3, chloroplastic n=1 Tax=Porphyridium purpureum TaxID=35688 RepID=A0A5J4YTL7_PORPP|nr:Photosynthetic NDH subunit of subcomplex B 3, chloroplastic [Porphyridium purpureum]|eukprot:POR2622..scf227_4
MAAFVSGSVSSSWNSNVSKSAVCKRERAAVLMVFGSDTVATAKKCTVRVEEGNKTREIQVDAGKNLRRALLDAKVDLYTLGGKFRNCGGNGACGTCVVEVLENPYGGVTPMTTKETFLLTGKPNTWRLACRAEVTSDLAIRTKPKQN